MKTTIKILAALAVMMGFSINAMAQTTDNDAIKAQATVMAGVNVTAGTPLNFQNVVPGVVKTIDFTNAVTAGTATAGETTGYWVIDKGANTKITVEINTAANLNLTSGSNNLPITYTGRFRTNADPSSPGNVHPLTNFASTSTENSGTTAPFFAADKFYVDLGGTVTPTTNQPTGAYEATITLTATYN